MNLRNAPDHELDSMVDLVGDIVSHLSAMFNDLNYSPDWHMARVHELSQELHACYGPYLPSGYELPLMEHEICQEIERRNPDLWALRVALEAESS
ncbi:hypothetical protein HC928_01350 [bacterium]|nr:hypothetical protein [bacterium]